MSWIAKNSLTGCTYGNAFSSIYDCQEFISKELYLIEYLSQRVKVLEDSTKQKLLIDEYCKENNCNYIVGVIHAMEIMFKPFVDEMSKTMQTVLLKKPLKDKKLLKNVSNPIHDLANTMYCSNNVIRCWYVEQKRFAEGFDF